MAWPTTTNPRTEFVTLRLTAGEAALLDEYAQAQNMTRSAALRDAVDRVTAADRRNRQRQAQRQAQQQEQEQEQEQEQTA